MGIQRSLVVQFVAGTPARTAAELVGVNRNTAILYFQKLREVIAEKLAVEAPFSVGEVEVDESYFGGYRKGKRGRGAAGKVPVFGLLKRAGKVYTTMIPDTKSPTLVGIIREKIQPDSIVYTDCYGSYDILDVSEFHHERINHREAFVTKGKHINGIENFWSLLKRSLGGTYISVEPFHLDRYLGEQCFRFNTSKTHNDGSRFKKLVSQVTGKRLTYAEVTGKVGETAF